VAEQSLTTILWRGRWLIAISLAVSIALAVLVTRRTDKVYEATATIQVVSGNTSSSGNDAFDAQLASQGLATTYATLLVDRGFLEQIRPDVAGGALGTSELVHRLSARAIKDTALVELSAEGATTEEARRLATDVVAGFLDTIEAGSRRRTERFQSRIQEQISQINDQIATLRRGNATENAEQIDSLRAAKTALTQQLGGLVAGGIAQSANVTLAAPPTASATPIRPRPALNLVAGILLGLIVGSSLSYLRAFLDRGLHSSAEVEELLEAPVLASVPLRRRYSVDDAVLGEAYDVLRANLAFLALDQPLQVITFSSYNPGEGKSSTVEGLAYAAVRGGLNVLVIDGDVRTRTLSRRLGHGDSPGLTNVVAGMATLDRTVIELAPGLSLLPSGPTPPNPPSLLSSGRMRDMLAELRERHTLILIDSPPVAHLADASVLAALSEGIVLVARVGVTERADLGAAMANLRHIPTPLIGAVVLQPQRMDEAYYPAITKGTAAVPDRVASH
jgi:receptor protein-tyrosine kinase